MKIRALTSLLFTFLLVSSSLYAEEYSGDTNLQKELAPPSATSGDAEIRSYTREDKAKITEYSKHGHVYLIKVQPAGGLPPYYLEDSNGDGKFNQRLPGGYQRINPPMWIIKEF
ncbi:MAG: DUF2782 domain-containing protein [Mariprofundaceae bacterium]|nr:DUF2782 domain-containing protein [Mariprofundaceae bacterium]